MRYCVFAQTEYHPQRAIAINQVAPQVCNALGAGDNIAYVKTIAGFQCGACMANGDDRVYNAEERGSL